MQHIWITGYWLVCAVYSDTYLADGNIIIFKSNHESMNCRYRWHTGINYTPKSSKVKLRNICFPTGASHRSVRKYIWIGNIHKGEWKRMHLYYIYTHMDLRIVLIFIGPPRRGNSLYQLTFIFHLGNAIFPGTWVLESNDSSFIVWISDVSGNIA